MNERDPAEVRLSNVLPELTRVLGDINLNTQLQHNQIINEVKGLRSDFQTIKDKVLVVDRIRSVLNVNLILLTIGNY